MPAKAFEHPAHAVHVMRAVQNDARTVGDFLEPSRPASIGYSLPYRFLGNSEARHLFLERFSETDSHRRVFKLMQSAKPRFEVIKIAPRSFHVKSLYVLRKI